VAVKFFGQFLLGREVVTRKQLVEAVKLQDERNLPLGAYAVRKRYLGEADCTALNQGQRKEDRLFGELAVKRGLLTPAQVQELLALQTQEHIRIGQALVVLGYLTPQRLASELLAFAEDQRSYSSKATQARLAITAVAVDMTQKMLLRVAGVACKIGEPEAMSGPLRPDLLHVQIRFSGSLAADYILSLSPDVADGIVRRMLGAGDHPHELALDAIMELCNIICGACASRLEHAGHRIDITPPDARPRDVAAGAKGVLIPLPVIDGTVEIRVVTYESAAPA
jgi:CheY-specific phosphatase CheX